MWAILEEISGQPTWKTSKQKNIKNVNGVGKVWGRHCTSANQ